MEDKAIKLASREIDRISVLAYEMAGIMLNQEKSAMIKARLEPRLRASRKKSFYEYLNFIESDGGLEERGCFLRALTTNLTKFYREPHHFVDFRENILPSILPRLRSGSRFRIWSSACSTGEEAYSIAFEILDAYGDEALDLDIRILATDINVDVIAKASTACYGTYAVRNLPPRTLKQFFTEVNQKSCIEFRVIEDARSLIRFRELNLLKTWPMSGKFDVIFCRNVLIYFSKTHQEELVYRFANVTKTNARLYLGHSERITGAAKKQFDNIGMTSYVRV